jgi:hypothetical protein
VINDSKLDVCIMNESSPTTRNKKETYDDT